MMLGELLDIVAERIRKDKLAQVSFTDANASRIAHITLDSLAHNIGAEIMGRDKSMREIADRFVEACGPRYRKPA